MAGGGTPDRRALAGDDDGAGGMAVGHMTRAFRHGGMMRDGYGDERMRKTGAVWRGRLILLAGPSRPMSDFYRFGTRALSPIT